jgi:hypothetical protein
MSLKGNAAPATIDLGQSSLARPLCGSLGEEQAGKKYAQSFEAETKEPPTVGGVSILFTVRSVRGISGRVQP